QRPVCHLLYSCPCIQNESLSILLGHIILWSCQQSGTGNALYRPFFFLTSLSKAATGYWASAKHRLLLVFLRVHKQFHHVLISVGLWGD
ncbi:hypothetical protein AALO_G00020430, partial [Alosa alosa]